MARYGILWKPFRLFPATDTASRKCSSIRISYLERLAIIAVDTAKNIVLPEAGNLAKLRIDQANLESIFNVEKQTHLNVLISSVVNFDGFDIVDGSQSLKYLSIDLSGSELDIGSLMNLESARLTMPEYKKISPLLISWNICVS
ncbi:hypothetical protein TUM17379_17240 [Shewanella algae]|uniref:Uncharacterized protein n=1 Tax=Shewanella algae TaxID=38313 RepID=A0AAD1K8C3_9GAMM|nr:hypothetical protein TUM17379_17240 [Shewanella algae]